jgi:hypothetical protein
MDAIPSVTPERPPAGGQQRWTPAKAAAAFVACGRCGFFIAGYRLIHHDFDQAVQASEGQTLRLSWDEDTAKLLEKSYGLQIEANCYHLEGLCPNCWRPFAFDAGDDAIVPGLTIHIVPD